MATSTRNNYLQLIEDELQFRNNPLSPTTTHIKVSDFISEFVNSSSQPANVKDYGAIGNGTVDDTAAFLAAIAADNGPVFVPKGTYLISSSLTLGYGQSIVGTSKTDSIIVMETNNIPIIICNGHSIVVNNIRLMYQTQQQNTYGSYGHAIALCLGWISSDNGDGGCHESLFSNIIIEKAYNGIALPIWSGSPFAFGNIFDNIRIVDHAEYAVRIEPASGEPTTNTFRNVYALAQTNWNYPDSTVPKGFYFKDNAEVVLDNCSIDWCQDEVVQIDSCDMVTISNLHIEACRVKTNNRGLLYLVNSPNIVAGGIFFYGNKLEGVSAGNFMTLILNDNGFLKSTVIVERLNTYTTLSNPRFISDGVGATAVTLSDKVTTSSSGFTNLLRGTYNLNARQYILTGTGTPEAARTAPVGSLYLRTDGGASTTLYIKESGVGNTGWVAK